MAFLSVALRKESVDRNGNVKWKIVATYVALRKESVDRNSGCGVGALRVAASLSARRAWIEMLGPACLGSMQSVALRKESVDRNVRIALKLNLPLQSLSARRAWIEILRGASERSQRGSLSARRAWIEIGSLPALR